MGLSYTCPIRTYSFICLEYSWTYPSGGALPSFLFDDNKSSSLLSQEEKKEGFRRSLYNDYISLVLNDIFTKTNISTHTVNK